MRKIDPDTIAAPVGVFSHAIEVTPDARRLYVSGQIGVDSNGELGADAEAQARPGLSLYRSH